MINKFDFEGIRSSLGQEFGPYNDWHKYEFCPHCLNEHPNNPAFGVNWKTGVYKCHDCGAKGSFFNSRNSVEYNRLSSNVSAFDINSHEIFDEEFFCYKIAEQDSKTAKYLFQRGIKYKTMQMLDVPLREEEKTNRIAVYPFFNKLKNVIAYQSVFLDKGEKNFLEKKRRYKGKKSLGVGILRRADKVIVSEGLETGLSVLQELGSQFGLIVCGDTNGLISLSSNNSWALSGTREIVVATDNDKSNAGLKAARSLIYAFPKKTSLYMPSLPGNDWNDVLMNGNFEEEWQ